MGKGEVWINGQSIGRHWPSYTAQGSCSSCDYAGIFNDKKCRIYCGDPSQRWYEKRINNSGFYMNIGSNRIRTDIIIYAWVTICVSVCFRYHVPRSWLTPTGNFLVVFEELGGDPGWVSLVKRKLESVCADIYDGQPSLNMQNPNKLQAKAHLWCPPGQNITAIKFASYGNPEGTCGKYQEGSCHARRSYDALQKVWK